MILAAALAVLWGNLEAGPYAAGFRMLYDKTSPVRINVWYPAGTNGSAPMSYGGYLDAADREEWTEDLKPKRAARLFATPTAAHRDAPPAAGRFPLVLYSGGFGAYKESNPELGEYLASHGFVVVSVPNNGMTDSTDDLEAHTRDLEKAWQRVAALPFVDNAHVATSGHSLGGIVALYLAMRHPDVKAVIGLDGSYGFPGASATITQLASYDPSRVRAALLDLRRAAGVQGADHDRSVMLALHTDRYLTSIPRMFHDDFREVAPIDSFLGIRPDRAAIAGNLHVCRAVLAFLEGDIARTRAEVLAVRGAKFESLHR